jgi:hypothetical protein
MLRLLYFYLICWNFQFSLNPFAVVFNGFSTVAWEPKQLSVAPKQQLLTAFKHYNKRGLGNLKISEAFLQGVK